MQIVDNFACCYFCGDIQGVANPLGLRLNEFDDIPVFVAFNIFLDDFQGRVGRIGIINDVLDFLVALVFNALQSVSQVLFAVKSAGDDANRDAVHKIANL
jgi:hypothetical protein